jgi:uncharacterized delta-60 repeat protein
MSAPRAGSIAATAAIAMMLACVQAAAGAATPDPGFTPGVAFGLGDRAAAIALAADGRIVVVGDRRGAGGEGALTARMLPNGLADGSFAGGLRIDKYGTGASPQRAGAVAVQPDGSTLVAGVAGDQWSLARFEATGLADGLFGAAGVTLRDPSPGRRVDEEYPDEEPALPDGTGPAAIALEPGGDIVVAGNTGVATDDGVPGEQIVVARYTSRGLPDPAFGGDGFAVFQLGAGSARRHASSAARGLALLADGRIVIAGRASGPDGGDRAFVAQLTPSGRLDPAFGRGGRTIIQFGRSSAARVASSSFESLAARPDGRLLTAGWATDVAGSRAVLLARFQSLGALDASYGVRGSVVSQLGGAGRAGTTPVSLARALVVQADGVAVVAGAASKASTSSRRPFGGALTARYGSDGALDCGYGKRGRTVVGGVPFDPAVDGAFGAAQQPDGSLVLAGRFPGGRVDVRRLYGGASVSVPAGRPGLVTLGARYTDPGRGYAYGLVDGRCSAVDVRFTVKPASGRSTRTAVRRVFGRSGPQVVCASLRGLRPGGRYRIRLAATKGAAHGAEQVLRAVKLGRGKPPAQQGCAG